MAKYDISKKATSENTVCRCAPMLRALVVRLAEGSGALSGPGFGPLRALQELKSDSLRR